jgi:apolipoprotein N-acyltransferase
MNRAVAALAALVTGTLVFLAFPGWNIHYLAWFGLVPLIIALRTATVRQGFLFGLLAGTVTNAGGFHWMTVMLEEFGHMPAAPAYAILGVQALTQGLTMAIGFGLWRFLANRGAPSAWACWLALWAGEAIVPMIFPWFMGNAISKELPMIQIADLGGVHLVSALIFAANVALAEVPAALLARRKPAFLYVLAVLAAVAASWAYGTVRIGQVDADQAAAKKIRIGMVEGNVGIWEKEGKYLEGDARAKTLRHNLLKHQQMSAQLQKAGAELIVWPESAYQPYGFSPVLHTLDHFLIVGDGGAIWRHDGKELHAENGLRLGLPRDVKLLSGISSPRGDIWRVIDQGKRILTVTPKGTSVVDMPSGETAIATVFPPVDPFGRMPVGTVIASSGRMWLLPVAEYVAERDPNVHPVPDPGDGTKLVPLAEQALGPVALTAAARSGTGVTIGVGLGGAIVQAIGNQMRKLESPTHVDLWTVAADSQGDGIIAGGQGGTILRSDGIRWVVDTLGDKDWYASWFGADGSAWLAGKDGALAHKLPLGTWKLLPPLAAVDLVAGGCDADGNVLVVGRGGRMWFGQPGPGRMRELNTGSAAEITAVLGELPQASYLTPRSAKRIVASQTPLPDASLKYPDDVIADEMTPESDRASPRRGFSVPLLYGAMTHASELPSHHAGCKDCFNSALLQGPTGEILAIYDKAFLLMFGEYIPFGEKFPQLYELSPETSRFQSGTRTAPIELALKDGRVAKLGMLICYEDLVPGYAKRVAAHDPNLFVNLTNDAWFGQSAEPEHHLNLALIRTVEYRRWLLRSTNTGISVFIDAVGRRVAETALTGEETLMRDVPLMTGRTVYAVLGDWPLLALALGLVTLWARTLAGKKPKKRGKG